MGSPRRLRHLVALVLLMVAACLVAIAVGMVDSWRTADGPHPYGIVGAGVLALGAVSAVIVAILLVVTDWKR